MLYTSMYIYAYVYVCYVSPAYSRCFISSLILWQYDHHESVLFFLLPFTPFSHSLFLSLSLSLFTSRTKCVFRVNVLVVNVCLVMYVCFLHKILRIRRFYKTLPWNNVLYAVRGDRSRGKYRGYIFQSKSPFRAHVRSAESLRDRYFQCAPLSAIHLVISFILFCDLATTDSHPYIAIECSVSLRSTLSTATLRNNFYWSTVYCHTFGF